MKNSGSQKEGLNFLNHTNMYTKEKMNIDHFLRLDTIRLVGASSGYGLHPDSTDTEMEIRFFFNRSEIIIFDYVLDSITRLPDPNLPRRVNKKTDFWYCYGNEKYIGKYNFTDSTISFNALSTRDSLVKAENISYNIVVKRWLDNYDYEVELVRLKNDKTQ